MYNVFFAVSLVLCKIANCDSLYLQVFPEATINAQPSEKTSTAKLIESLLQIRQHQNNLEFIDKMR